jgi:hypothetical protein
MPGRNSTLELCNGYTIRGFELRQGRDLGAKPQTYSNLYHDQHDTRYKDG